MEMIVRGFALDLAIVIFKMVYMKENHLESKHGENSLEEHYGDIRRLENI